MVNFIPAQSARLCNYQCAKYLCVYYFYYSLKLNKIIHYYWIPLRKSVLIQEAHALRLTIATLTHFISVVLNISLK